MKVPFVTEASLQAVSKENKRHPNAIMERDPVLYAECIKTVTHSRSQPVAVQSCVFAYHAVHLECVRHGLTLPQLTEKALVALNLEMIEEGARWDREIAHRIRLEQKLFHHVFSAWSLKTGHPDVATFASSKMYRITELLLQPL